MRAFFIKQEIRNSTINGLQAGSLADFGCEQSVSQHIIIIIITVLSYILS
jgi:hypothetical protein